MQCATCGNPLTGTEAFCGRCGTRVEKTAPSGPRFCPKCGSELTANTNFCEYCGFQVAGAAGPGYATASQYPNSGGLSFAESVRVCLAQKFAVCRGRASRSEYWWFFLFNILLSAAYGAISLIPVINIIGFIALIVFCIPSFCVGIRRLHDLNASGWFCLIWLIPLVGSIFMLIWFCQKGTTGPNRFGPDPLQ